MVVINKLRSYVFSIAKDSDKDIQADNALLQVIGQIQEGIMKLPAESQAKTTESLRSRTSKRVSFLKQNGQRCIPRVSDDASQWRLR